MEVSVPAHKSIWSCIDEVNSLQERATTYLALYEQFIIKSEETNEFLLPPTNREIAQHEPRATERPSNPWQAEERSEFCIDTRRVIEESIEFEPRVANLSRIFEEISLGEEVRRSEGSIAVELHLDSRRTVFTLGKRDDSYSLSNFNSFNNDKSKENVINFEVKDLLLKVQEQAGRQLSRKGVQSVIDQLQAATALQTEVEEEVQEKMRESEITQHSLKASNVESAFNTHNAFDFELETRRLKERKDLTNIPELFERREEELETDTPLHVQGDKENRRGSQLQYKKRGLPTKEIRIIRKNCPKSSLVMTYTDPRQLENFCISNKIYGRDKERIAKAIREGKTILSLD